MSIKERKFVIYFILFAYSIVMLSYLINKLDFMVTDSDLIRKYQFSKINNEENKDVNIVIVGDSSAGNAINAKLFGKLYSKKTLNLSLAGNFGLAGSYNMVRHAKKALPKLETIIIIQTLDIWRRPFSYQGYFDTLSSLDSTNLSKALQKNLDYENILYQVNPKEIRWFINSFKNKKINNIDKDLDYIRQKDSRYSSKKNIIIEDVISGDIVKDKISTYILIDELCKDIECIYTHGPIHDYVYNKSLVNIDNINDMLKQTSNNIRLIEKINNLDNKKMGDAIDHVDSSYKNKCTTDYFNLIHGSL